MRTLLLSFSALLLFAVVFAWSGTANATAWPATAASYGYSAADTTMDGGNLYIWRTVTDFCKQIQYGTANPHDDSLESNNSTSTPTPIPIGFDFRFMGQYYTGVYVSTNGAICLVNDENIGTYSNTHASDSVNWDMIDSPNFRLPRFVPPNGVELIPTIMIWQEDMSALSTTLSWGNTITNGIPELVVTFSNLDYYNSQISSQITCQVVLRKNGDILCQYMYSLDSADSGMPSADPGVGICGMDPLGNQVALPIYYRNDNNDSYPGSYSCITFIAPPEPASIEVLHPNGGELFFIGSSVTVSWSVTNGPLSGGADIQVSLNNGNSWTTVATGITDNYYTWTVATATSTMALIKVLETNLASTQDISDAVFEIREPEPGITITSPSSASSLDWVVGDTMTISWVAVGAVGTNATISVSRDQGVNWTTIAAGINPKTSSSYDWVVTAPHTDGVRLCYIKIEDNTGVSAVSSPSFAVFDVPILDLTYPNGGETVFIDTPTNILWDMQGLVGFFVKLELSRDGGINWETITGGTNNDGEYSWTPSGATTSTARIRVTSSYGSDTYMDTSANIFTISETAALAVTSPNGGESFTVGDQISITWNSRGSGVGNFVAIEISRDGGQNFETIADSAQNIGYYTWVVTGPMTDRALVKISPVSNPTANDVSDGVFEIIAEPGIYLLTPEGGESFFSSEILEITWFTSGITGNYVDIQLSRDNGASWENIITHTANDDTYSWVVSGELSEACLIRIVSTTHPEFNATSAGTFSITELTDTVFVEPFNGGIWETGTYRTIRWKTSVFESASVRIAVYRSKSGWEDVAVTTTNDGVYDWFVSGADVACQIRVSSLINLSKNYVSDVFSIIERYSIDEDAFGQDASANAGEAIPFNLVVNPADSFSEFVITLNYDSSVLSIPEPLAVIKGGAFTGWTMDVNINNNAGVLTVTLSGQAEFLLPAVAFTVNFDSLQTAGSGVYEVGIADAKFNDVSTSNILTGKITLKAVVDENQDEGNGGGGGCFVATAAFGSMSAYAVENLCSARDSIISASASGASLVSLYYELSPDVAVSTSDSLRAVIRRFLD